MAPYEQGFLLSEVPFGTGMTDQRALFAMLRKHNPRINAVTELITRDPLKVPVLSDDYYRSLPDQRDRRDRWLAMVKARQTALPMAEQLTAAQRYQLEEDNSRQVCAWGVANLTRV